MHCAFVGRSYQLTINYKNHLCSLNQLMMMRCLLHLFTIHCSLLNITFFWGLQLAVMKMPLCFAPKYCNLGQTDTSGERCKVQESLYFWVAQTVQWMKGCRVQVKQERQWQTQHADSPQHKKKHEYPGPRCGRMSDFSLRTLHGHVKIVTTQKAIGSCWMENNLRQKTCLSLTL